MGEVYAASLDRPQESLGVERASILLFNDAEAMSFVAWRGISDDYRQAVNGHTPWRPAWTSSRCWCVMRRAIRVSLAGVTVLVVEDDDDTLRDFGVDLPRRRCCGGLACRILGAEERGNQSDGLPPSGVNEARSL